MSEQPNAESAFLRAGIEKIRPLLEVDGFLYEPGDEGSSSGGRFATGVFRRGNLEIGLIVRRPGQLGCPNYSEGNGFAGHGDLFWALGRNEQQNLIRGDFVHWAARNGGDAFDALEVDLREVILPALRESEEDFRSAIARAYQRDQDRLFGKPE